jgi:hypothetical protein
MSTVEQRNGLYLMIATVVSLVLFAAVAYWVRAF